MILSGHFSAGSGSVDDMGGTGTTRIGHEFKVHSKCAYFRRAASFFPSGVAHIKAGTTTMTVSSLSIVSYDPPMVAVSIANGSRKGADVLEAKCFRISLLRTGQEDAAMNASEPEQAGLAEFRCSVNSRIPTGDHTLLVAEVTDLEMSRGFPLVYWRRGLHAFRPSYPFMASRAEFEGLIRRFEGLTLTKPEWTHAAHVAVAAHYAVRQPGTALAAIRTRIKEHNVSIGVANTSTSGYHETLTVLWLAIVLEFTRGADDYSAADDYIAAGAAVEAFAEERDLHSLYYSFDVVRDASARRSWCPPDLAGPFRLSPMVIGQALASIQAVSGI